MAQHIVLPIFEGPLDLLLFLINKAQIEINDIFVSNITEQYLGYTSGMTLDNMENKSSFIIMAARLLEIKSNKLLPKSLYLIEDEEDEENKLIRQLQEYKMYKAACEKLKEAENISQLRYYRIPEEILERTELDLSDVNTEMLRIAFSNLISQFEKSNIKTEAQEIERETFSVQEKIFTLRKLLISKKKILFKDLFDKNTTKSEVIVTFMALLELSRLGKIAVKQDYKQDSISIVALNIGGEIDE